MNYDLWFTRKIHTSNYQKQLRKEQRMVINTEKQNHVVSLLDRNVNMPTKDIIADYDEWTEGRDSISARHVQRIRKWFKANNVKGDKKDMNQDDVFDSKNSMHDWQIEILNLANEGGWSIQQIAEKLCVEYDSVRKTLTDFEFMVSNQVLDEDSADVYFNPTVPIPDSLLPEPPDTLGMMDIEKTGEPEVNKSATNDDYWEVKIDCVNACGKVDQSIDVFMNKTARDKAMRFMKWAKKREWLAYLIGEKKDDGYYVYDLYLPDQRTSATLVDKVVAENYNQMKVIGVIHSHHEMGAGDVDSPSFSGHDTEFINSNHNLSLLAGKNGNGFTIVGIARVKTPCDAFMKVKANVKAMFEQPTDEETALKDEFFQKVFDKSPKNEQDNQGDGSYHFTNNPTVTKR